MLAEDVLITLSKGNNPPKNYVHYKSYVGVLMNCVSQVEPIQ